VDLDVALFGDITGIGGLGGTVGLAAGVGCGCMAGCDVGELSQVSAGTIVGHPWQYTRGVPTREKNACHLAFSWQ